MKGITIPLGYVLVFAVGSIIAFAAFPWINDQLNFILEKAEMGNVKNDFIKCSEKILEVARTGGSQKCVFSVSRGDLFVRRDGIYYRLISPRKICSPHYWKFIGIEKIQQRCRDENSTYVYELRWFYPKNDTIMLEGSITIDLPTGEKTFSLSNTGYLNIEFESPEGIKGKTIELTRKLLEGDKAVLLVKIY